MLFYNWNFLITFLNFQSQVLSYRQDLTISFFLKLLRSRRVIWSFSVFFPTFSQFFYGNNLRTWAHQDSFWFTQVFSTICHRFLLAYANSYPALWIRHPIAIRNSITIVVYLAHSWHFHFHLHLHFHFPFSTVTLIVILQTGERVQFSVQWERERERERFAFSVAQDGDVDVI